MCLIKKVILLGYIHNIITISLVLISTTIIIDKIMIPAYAVIDGTVVLLMAVDDKRLDKSITELYDRKLSKEEGAKLLHTFKEVSDITKDFTKDIFTYLVILYVFGVLANYVLQQYSLFKQAKKIKELSGKNIQVSFCFDRETSSFRIARQKYIFLSVMDFIKNKGLDLDFIIKHEIFHTICFDGIVRRFVILLSFVIPAFMVIDIIIIRIFPYTLKWVNDLSIENGIHPIFVNNRQYLDYFFILASMILLFLIVIDRKDFLSSFFHYREFLADRYAMLKTNHIYRFRQRVSSNAVYHPRFDFRILAMENSHSQLKVDYYFYLIAMISTVHNYRYISIFLGVLFLLSFFIWQKDMYISLKGTLISLLLHFLPMLSFGSIYSEEYKSFINYSYFDNAGHLLILVLVSSFIISFINKRSLL